MTSVNNKKYKKLIMNLRNETKTCPTCGKIFTKKDIYERVKTYDWSEGRKNLLGYIETVWRHKKYCTNKCRDSYCSQSAPSPFQKLNILSCQICGYDEFPILEVHHIKERCNGGNSNHNNLIVVCPNCHIKIHKKMIQFIP